MTFIPNAGPAIHEIFPRLRHSTFSPHHMKPQEARVILHSMKASRELPILQPVFLEEVLFCWRYLKEVVELADSFRFEPKLAGLIHDLLIYHQQRVYVVEIKTIYNATPKTANKRLSKGIKQVQEGMAYIRRTHAPETIIYGYVLLFTFSSDGKEPDVEWKEIFPPPIPPPLQ